VQVILYRAWGCFPKKFKSPHAPCLEDLRTVNGPAWYSTRLVSISLLNFCSVLCRTSISERSLQCPLPGRLFVSNSRCPLVLRAGRRAWTSGLCCRASSLHPRDGIRRFILAHSCLMHYTEIRPSLRSERSGAPQNTSPRSDLRAITTRSPNVPRHKSIPSTTLSLARSTTPIVSWWSW
jgi:hypothetical protein